MLYLYFCTMKKARIAIFASGTGTNARALMEYFSTKEHIHVEHLISNKEDCGAIVHAKRYQVDVKIFSDENISDGEIVNHFLQQKKIDFIVLAGFLRKIPLSVIQSFPNKIINLHPALLPNFGGKGMYGKFVHAAVLNAKKKESGITIHTVNENYDEGNYIAQFYTLVLEDETVSSLEKKIRELEQRYFSCVVDGYINSIIK